MPPKKKSKPPLGAREGPMGGFLVPRLPDSYKPVVIPASTSADLFFGGYGEGLTHNYPEASHHSAPLGVTGQYPLIDAGAGEEVTVETSALELAHLRAPERSLAEGTAVNKSASSLGKRGPSHASSAVTSDDDDEASEKPVGKVQNVPQAARAKVSSSDLSLWSHEASVETFARLINGFRATSGASYGPAVRQQPGGCLLAQKAPSGKYIQCRKASKRKRGPAGSTVKADEEGNGVGAQRLAVWVDESRTEDHRRLVHKGEPDYEASHLCHQPTCIESTHIVVEPKKANEARKACAHNLIRLYIIVPEGIQVVAESEWSCPHSPPCLPIYKKHIVKEGGFKPYLI